MNFLDIDLSDVTTNTLNTLSDISNSSSQENIGQTGGGILDFLFGHSTVSKADSAVLEAAKLKKYDFVEFMIERGAVDLSAQDKDGNTVLHYLVDTSSPNQELIKKILKLPNVKKFVDIQNNKGNSPLFVAVMNEHHDLCYELIENAKANKYLRNFEGFHILSEDQTPQSSEFMDLSLKHKQEVSALPLRDRQSDSLFGSPTSPLSINSPIFVTQITKEESDKIFEPFMKLFNRKLDEPVRNTSEAGSFKDLKTEIKQDTQEGGGCGCGSKPPVIVQADTESLLNDLQKYFSVTSTNNVQEGGKNKKKVSGKRKVSVTRKRKSSVNERNFELGRIINTQTDEIIKKVVDKIQKMIGDDKKHFKGLVADEATARAAKAVLWKMVKEKNPELKSSLDIAIEMEKLATDEVIKGLKVATIKSTMKDIEKHRAEKEKEKEKRKSEVEPSATSSEDVPVMTNLSETSY